MEVSIASRSWGTGTECSGLSIGLGEAWGELTAEQALQPPWQRASQMLAWENRKVVAAQVTQVASEAHLSHPSGKTVTKGSG